MTKSKGSRTGNPKGDRTGNRRRRAKAKPYSVVELEELGIATNPSHLRGLAVNRYGGNQLQRQVGFRGSAELPAGPVRVYTEQERKEYEQELRARGDLK
jgi:hypothetical protein